MVKALWHLATVYLQNMPESGVKILKIASIIQYQGDNSVLIWKYPEENFNTCSQLIVHESQEAIFFVNGQALDLFGPGRYTLTTQNIPLIGELFNLATGGVTPFHCKVYFINKAEQMSIKWGTNSRIEYVEPNYHFPLSIGANGEMSLKVADSRKLLLKLVGTESDLSQQKLISFFRAVLMTKIKSYISQVIKEEKINIFEIDSHLTFFSKQLHEMLIPDFLDYGISLQQFFMTTVAKPDDDAQYQKFKELHFRQYADVAEAKLRQQTGIIDAQTEAQKTIINSQALATKRAQEGYTYQQERSFDVAAKVAENNAFIESPNMGLGLDPTTLMRHAATSVVQNTIHTTVSFQDETPPANLKTCAQCGTCVPAEAKFCAKCGTTFQVPVPDGMIVCPICGNIVPIGKFCIKCGHKFASICPNCGSKLPDGANFCLKCGKKL